VGENYKHASLPRNGINHGGKKSYCTAPGKVGACIIINTALNNSIP